MLKLPKLPKLSNPFSSSEKPSSVLDDDANALVNTQKFTKDEITLVSKLLAIERLPDNWEKIKQKVIENTNKIVTAALTDYLKNVTNASLNTQSNNALPKLGDGQNGQDNNMNQSAGRGKKTSKLNKPKKKKVMVRGGSNAELSPAVFNTGSLLNMAPPEEQAYAHVPALTGPAPFSSSSGTSAYQTLDAKLPDSYVRAMTGGRSKSGRKTKK